MKTRPVIVPARSAGAGASGASIGAVSARPSERPKAAAGFDDDED
jgi:hypothetical protein